MHCSGILVLFVIVLVFVLLIIVIGQIAIIVQKQTCVLQNKPHATITVNQHIESTRPQPGHNARNPS